MMQWKRQEIDVARFSPSTLCDVNEILVADAIRFDGRLRNSFRQASRSRRVENEAGIVRCPSGLTAAPDRPVTATSLAPSTMGRNASKIFGQTIVLAAPVSSSSVMKITPLALPGRCRTSTSPATVTRRPDGVAARRSCRHWRRARRRRPFPAPRLRRYRAR